MSVIKHFQDETPEYNGMHQNWKEDEGQDDKSLYESFVFAKVDDIRFGMWLAENGWKFYDGDDRLINLKANNIVAPITELFADYKKENPEP